MHPDSRHSFGTIEKSFERGETILIVGGRPTNFAPGLQRHKQFIFWYNHDSKTFRRRDVPQEVQLVVFCTKFMTHSLKDRIKSRLNARTPSVRLSHTNLLGSLVKEEALPSSPPVVQQKNGNVVPVPCFKGTVRDFVRDQLTISFDAEHEALRLADLAKAVGLESSAEEIYEVLETVVQRLTASILTFLEIPPLSFPPSKLEGTDRDPPEFQGAEVPQPTSVVPDSLHEKQSVGTFLGAVKELTAECHYLAAVLREERETREEQTVASYRRAFEQIRAILIAARKPKKRPRL